MSKKIHLSLALISAALIAFQIILMQLLSITQWHHFAFMIISLALLGFGAAGTILSLFKDWFVDRKEFILPIAMLLSGIFIGLSVPLSQLEVFRFDTFLLFADSRHILKLLFTYLLLFLPFFFGAISIGLIFVAYSSQIGKLYFSNLVGSGFGGIGALIILSLFEPAKAPLIISVLSILAGITLLQRINKKITAIFAIIFVAIIIVSASASHELKMSQYKSLSKTLNLPNAEIIIEKNSPHGFIQVVESDALRYAPGLS